MQKKSAGIILYRYRRKQAEVLLVHPGGPFWSNKDFGAWSIPKGEFEDDENPLDAAMREMEEETGIKISGKFIELSPVKQKSGKQVYAWAIRGNVNPAQIKSNEFELEWPPGSGKKKTFPEIDRAGWFTTMEAKERIVKGQSAFIEELERKLSR